MVKINCSSTTVLQILTICNYYADNDCHPTISDDAARRLIKTLVEGIHIDPLGSCQVKIYKDDCMVLEELLKHYKQAVPHDMLEAFIKQLGRE